MAKYMIHCCLKRLWYVEKYLMPSMIEQGIGKDDIILYVDANNDGCLKSHVKSFIEASKTQYSGMWHLQDDVIICRDFKRRTEEYDDGIVCGFQSQYDIDNLHFDGQSNGKEAWYSFPCIRIPTSVITEYINWFNIYVWRDPQYGKWVKENKWDDTIWRIWLEQYHPYMPVLNLSPNLVDHIDYLIGGTTVNPKRRYPIVRAINFEDCDLVDELERKLKYDICERKDRPNET